MTALTLTSISRRWVRAPARSRLGAWIRSAHFREIEGDYYTLSASPTGDRLYVDRYEGEFGEVVLRSGGRHAGKLELNGALRSADHSLQLGEERSDKYKSTTAYP